MLPFGRRSITRSIAIDVPFAVKFVHRLRFTRDALSPGNATFAAAVAGGGGPPARVLVFLDTGVAEAWPTLPIDLKAYADAHTHVFKLAGPIQYVPGGERCKNDQRAMVEMLRAMDDANLCRQSYVVAIGGGAVLDVVGLAAALCHRGVRLIRFPTTTLGQGDSGIGVKNSINAFGKKNYLGTFAVPWAVINDEAFLTTLSDRDWRCGFVEAVKVACVKDRGFFEQIAAEAAGVRRRDHAVAMPIIQKSAEYHLRHITEGAPGKQPDPFETTTARPLDFGHWSAHKLEQMTGFRLRHGEAVAIGIALDVMYSELTGMLAAREADEVLRCLAALGLPLYDEAMEHTDQLIKGIEEFREHLGGQLTITLLARIGRGVDVHEVDTAVVRQAIRRLAAGRAERIRLESRHGSGRT